MSKRYRLGQNGALDRTLRDAVAEGLARMTPAAWRKEKETGEPSAKAGEFWALRDVNFDVHRGEVMGIVGANGAGKSTLLKILSRITPPTEGRAVLRGRVASLLEVGTGFHPELTGRENVFLNGAVLGMSRREVKAKFDAIVAFSGVESFLDTPVKRYSSGMRVRLAFAVASHLDPDILIVDEVLAVGDAAFQAKCLGKMQQLADGAGRTVLFVSHSMKAVRSLCHRVVWLEGGRVRAVGDSDALTRQYLEAANPTAPIDTLPARIAALPPDDNFRLLGVSIEQGGRPTTRVANDQPVEITFRYRVLRPAAGLRVYFDLCDEYGDLLVRSFNDEHEAAVDEVLPGEYESRAVLPGNLLAPREYRLVLQATVYNVRSCMPGGLHVPLQVEPTGRINRAYPHEPIRSKLQPLVQWQTEPLTTGMAQVA